MTFTPDISEKVWSLPGRGARIIVDLNAIETNVATIRDAVGPSVMVLAVVKAGGYGEGAPHAARAAVAGGASWLGTATVSEALELRAHGITQDILVLGATMAMEIETSIEAGVTLTIGSADQLAAFCRAVPRSGAASLSVFLKIDTGMHRFGVAPEEAVAAAHAIAEHPGMRFRGVFTHFARADESDQSPTDKQAGIFKETVAAIGGSGIDPGIVHASNSAATLRRRDLDFDMVRPGICLYGVRPDAGVPLLPGMQLAVRVEAAIQRVHTIPAGEEVGYGGTFRADRPTRTALLPLGYADGYRRALSGRSWVGFHGSKLPELGRVSMDQTVIELPDGCDAGYGSVVAVVGDGSHGEPSIEELATMTGTIPYEILTGFGQRLPAFYAKDFDVVAINNKAAS
jgi:alanine racemase